MKYSKITFKSSFELPYKFIGSTIRGAFGVGVKRVVCINPNGECKGCFAKENCLFYDFFERDFAKFRLNFNLDGKVDFSLFLFEEAANKAPYAISALHKAFSEIGITKNRTKLNDFKIFLNDNLVFDGEFKELGGIEKEFEFVADKNFYDIKLEFVTPLRIKENNRFLRAAPKLETLLRSINHRYLKIKNLPLEKLNFEPKYEIKNQNIHFIDFTRYSNRQKTKMKLGGIVGSMDMSIDGKSFEMLKLGELIGVGKQVTFGLGRVKVWQ